MANINYSNKLDVLKICHLNVRSLSAAFDCFCDLVKNKFDVICITETWLKITFRTMLFPSKAIGYCKKTGWAEVEELVFTFAIVSILKFLIPLIFPLRLNHSSFLIVVIYRPPHTPINASVGVIDDMLSFFSSQYDNILILGDINIDLFNHENPLGNCFDSFNFTQLIDEPTRVTRHSSTLLDPIFTNTPNKVVNSGTDFVSDHKLVFCDIILKVRKYEPKLITYRDVKNIDPIVFKYDVLGIGFDQIFYLRTIDEKVVCFTNHLLQLFDIHAPLRTARITKPSAPWLTDNMRSIFKLRDKAVTTFQNDPSDINWAAYKNMGNYSLASFRREKKAYLSRNVDINTRYSWNTLRNMNVCHNKRVEIPLNLLDPQEVNEYFLSTFIPADENIRLIGVDGVSSAVTGALPLRKERPAGEDRLAGEVGVLLPGVTCAPPRDGRILPLLFPPVNGLLLLPAVDDWCKPSAFCC
nr:unnamed protein product [Callosobruchus chinensis]